MNKSYISVWNDVTRTWVAAPETAKARGRATASSTTIPADAGVENRPATVLQAAFMPIALAIGAMGMSMLPGTAAAEATTGNGGLELCPGQMGTAGMGSAWGPLSSTVGMMSCSPIGTGDQGMSFSLNNGAADNGAWGYADNAITARVTGYADGRLELVGQGGISVLNTMNMNGNKITGLAAGNVSSSSSDAINGAQLYQYTRYFQANSPSSEPASSALATGASSVASGPYAIALGGHSSAYGANTVALASNSVALGAGSVASRSDSVSVGYLSADGVSQYTRQITNVTAGAAGTDAVNVNQLNAAIASVNGGGGGLADNAVVYDSSAAALITLKGTKGTKITNLTAGDISSGWSTDAVNGSQLYQTNQNVANVANNVANVAGNLANVTNVVNNIVNNGIAGNPLVVAYDSSARDIVTLGGTTQTAAVKLTNVAAGDISSGTSTDAVNGGQLYTTNQNLNALANNVSSAVINIYNHGVKYFHTNSTLADSSVIGAESVAIGGQAIASADNSVAIGSNSVADRANAVSIGSTTSQRQIINVAAGTQDTDAVNLRQMTAAINAAAGGGSPDAVVYDSSAHTKLTLGGTAATTAAGLTNVAAGQVTSSSKDAVNGSQLYNTASSVANALGGGVTVKNDGTITAPAYAISDTTYSNVGDALNALSTTTGDLVNASQYIKVVSGARAAQATGAESIAIGGSAMATGSSSVAIGSGASAKFANSTAIGVNAVTDAANTVSVGSRGAETRITHVANGVDGTDAATVAQLSALQTQLLQAQRQSGGLKSTLLGATVPVTNYIAVSANVTTGSNTSASSDLNAMAIGPVASAAGIDALAVGAGSIAGADGATAVGTRAQIASVNSTAVGTGATVGALSDNSVAIGYNSYARGIGAMGMGSYASASGAGSVAIGYNTFVNPSATNGMALGMNASVSAVNGVAIGYNSIADRANAVSVGSSLQKSQIINVAAGTSGTDAVNVTQLSGVTSAIGGGAAVNSDGTIKKPSFTIGGQTYTDVGSAIAAVSNGTSNGVQYDTTSRTKVTLGGVGASTAVALTNVANGVAASDAVNVAQLQAMGGTFNSSGVVTNAFVAYDDTTSGKVTLKGTGGTTITNLKAAAVTASSTDAVNGSQLYQTNANVANVAGDVVNVTNTVNNIVNGGGIKYFHTNSTLADSSATGTNSVAIGGAASASASNSVALGSNSVASRANAVSVGAAGSERQIINVANGTNGTDAVNVQQLQAMGGTFNSSGVVTNAFVAYDDTTKSKVTLGGTGATKAVTLTNVANGVATSDAVNVAQLQAMGGTFNSSGVVTNAFVAYDDTTSGKVTLKGTGGTTITNLKAAAVTASSTDAVNGSQLYQTNANVANVAGDVVNVTNTVNNIVNGGGIKYFHTNSTLADSSATGTNSVAIGGAASASASNSVALGSNSVASRANAVSVGAAGSERQIINVANGTNGTDAVNVQQLQAMGGTFNSSGVVTNAFVAYDDTTKSKVTLGGAGSTKAVTLTNVANGVATSDAVNVAQLQAMGGTFNSSGVVTNAFVAYDDTTKSKVTLGGTGSTKAVTLTNVANGVATSDAVNVAQLQAMGGTFNSSGVVTNAFVAYDDTTKSKVTLGGAGSSTAVALTNLVAGQITSSSRDAVNGSQLYGTANSVAQALGGGAAVSKDGTISAPGYLISGTTYNDAGSAFGAIDGQLASINENYASNLKYVKVVSTQSAAQASGREAIAIGGSAMATGDSALAIGSGASAKYANSTAIGVNAVTDAANTVSVGSRGAEMRITHVANGVATTDAATVGQLAALQTQLTQATQQSTGLRSMLLGAAVPVTSYIAVSSNVTTGANTSASTDMNAMAIGPVASAAGVDALALGAGSIAGASESTAIGARAQIASDFSTAIGAGATIASHVDNSVAIGYNSYVSGVDGMALGAAASASGSNSVAIGYNTFVAPSATNGVAMGTGASASAANAVAIGYNAVADRANAVSVGSSTQQSQIINVAPGTKNTDAVNLAQMNTAIAAVAGGGAPNAVVYDTSLHTKVTLNSAGAPVTVSNVADGVANNDAVNVEQLKAMGATIGTSGNVTNAFVAYDSTSKNQVTFGGTASTTPVVLANVGAGLVTSSSTQAINGSQLYGAMSSTAAALGGGSSVAANGTITKPSYQVNGGTYNDVGAALIAAASANGTGSPDAVLYDTSAHTSVSLGVTGSPVKVSNVADGVANNDAVNVAQLKAMGATIGTSGNVTNAFVAYDDTSRTKVTFGLGGSTTPVILSNVGSGQVSSSSTQAINGSQLYGAMSSTAAALGGSSSVTANGAISKPAYSLDGQTFTDVGAALTAVNAKAATGSVNGVVYDSSAHDKLTLGGVGSTIPVTLANVADAMSDDQAVNLKQLKAAGLNVDPTGNVTNSFVAYDNATKATVTFNAGGAPTQLKNVAAGTDGTDAVNVNQMQTYVDQKTGGGGNATNAVSYDDASRTQVTLGGAGSATPVTLTNVADGKNATDAVSYGQFSALENTVKNISDTGSTYVNINNPGSNGTAAVASGTDSIAIGNGAVASGSESIAIGKNTKTTGDSSVAMGSGASATNANAVALGANSTTDRDNTVSVGSTGAERQITNVAAGTQATDAVNVGQLNNAMGNMSNTINNVDRSAAKGIAAASALNIVTPYLPGRTTLNAGVANYRGYQAVGLGVSRWNEKGTVNYNLGVSTSGGNSTIVRAGIGIVLGN
ncbi:YadA-like family protein [Paraburkholderia caledonica]|uniref:Autotransporter adhesin n=1 Tax=Paraburkholderia caledonica TaxID=134536 RepID=A0ABU1L5C4_9BURK|nr:YadA-like family protein [Paraburkholderia caledonica]MDR6378373.1 autotransporter adhesin [Paraburkholderia caledonica]